MRSIKRTAVLLSIVLSYPLSASDACLERAIKTTAKVEVSDGSHFDTETFYQSTEFSAIRHIRDDTQLVAVEGPFSWLNRGEKSQTGGENLKQFALGHQFHALLLDFDKVVSGIEEKSGVQLQGGNHRGKGGGYPYGGEIILVHDDAEPHPKGLVLTLPETPRMEITFNDWRKQDGTSLPFAIEIDDGSRVFSYTYTRVEILQASPLWYMDALEAPAIDELQIYRLHRRLLAAHCIGDADMMADLSLPETIISGRGALSSVSREAMRSRFVDVFAQVDYLHYEDLVEPVIEVSESADIGWIAVNVRTRGSVINSGQAFDDQWSWIMLAEKVDGQWLNAGNASNRLTRPD